MINTKNAFFGMVRTICSLAVLTSLMYSSKLHVNINHPVYDYLDRLATQGLLPSYLNDTLPLKRDYIVQMLSKLNQQREELSDMDQALLDYYLADYRYELQNALYFKIPDSHNAYHPFTSKHHIKDRIKDVFSFQAQQENHHLVVYEKDKNLVWFDIGGMARYEMKNSDGRIPYSYKYKLSVLLGDHFIAYSDADLYAMIYNAGFDEKPKEFKGGFPVNHEGFYGFDHELSFDYAHAYIQYSSSVGNFAIVTEPLKWGNANNPIILSNNVPPFAMVSWDKRLARSRFSFFHGSILPADSIGLDNESLITYAAKYLVGHRWELSISDKLHIAFTEMLVYGGRDPELVYFIPNIFLWPVQHNMTSQGEDNIIWFVEAEYFPSPGLKLYGTFMIDDLRTSQMFNDWYNNRWAFQVGTHLTGIIQSFPTDIKLEFTAARPWVYTHRIPQYGTYTHNGRTLGFYPGPNSQLINIENRWWLSTRTRLMINYDQLKWGEKPKSEESDIYDFGNDSNHDYSNVNPDYHNKTGWLIGNINTNRTLRISWEYQLSNVLEFILGVSHSWGVDDSANWVSVQINVDY